MRPTTTWRSVLTLAFAWVLLGPAAFAQDARSEKDGYTPPSTLAERAPAGHSSARGGGFFEDFEEGIPENWAIFTNGIGEIRNWVAASSPTDDPDLTTYAFSRWEDVEEGLAEDWLVTPALALTSDAPSLSFDASQDFITDFGSVYSVLVSTTSQTDPATFTEVASYDERDGDGNNIFPVDAYGTFTVDLSAYAGMEVWIAFLHTNDDGDSWRLDNVSVTTGGTTIAEARAAGDGATVTVTGTVTRRGGNFVYIQDETAALAIRQTEGDFFDDVADGTIAKGTEITVTGTLSTSRGLLQINGDDLASYAVGVDGEIPEPQAVTLQEILDNGEAYEAELVRVTGLTTDATGTFEAATSYDVTDATATLEDGLRIPNADDTEVDGLPVPEGTFTFTGVVGQFTFDEPADNGYQLLAINAGDVEAEVIGALVFDPNPLVETLNTGETGVETVTITNTTDEAVTYDFVQYSGDGGRPADAAVRHDDVAAWRELGLRQRELGLQEGDPDPRLSSTPLRGEGGPDAFGYTWIDSNEPDGPAFEAIDIEATGDPVTLLVSQCGGTSIPAGDEGYADVDLPFTFSYYGEDYDAVRIWANGFVSFDLEDLPVAECSFINLPIPAPTPPNNMIAPMWEDFDGSDGVGSILTETLDDGRFVVQFNDWEQFAANDAPNTFQAILSPSGAIKFQYLELSGFFTYSIGIENQDGTDGLEIALGEGYAEEGLAVLISYAPTFVTDVDPATGTIPAMGSVDVDVTFSAEGLNGGTYDGTLVVETDLEGEDATFELPVVLVVEGEAGCVLTLDGDFDGTIVGVTSEVTATVTNDGTDACTLSEANVTGPFTVEGFEAVTLAPGESTSFTVVFTPTGSGEATGTLTVVLDGKDDLTVALTATGQAEPSFEVDPAALEFTVPVGGQASDTFTITNTGGADAAELEYEVSVVEARPAGDGSARAGDGSADGITFRTSRDGASRDGASRDGASAASSGTLRARFEAAVASRGDASRGDAGAFADAAGATAGGDYTEVSGSPWLSYRHGGITITHSESQEIEEFTGVSCPTPPNAFSRVFDLSEYDILGGLNVTSVEFGVETAVAQTTTINLYTLDGEYLLGNLTLVATTNVDVGPGDALSLVTAEIEAEFAEDDVMVVEWVVPQNPMFPGSNSAGQTGPTYVQADGCGAPEPTDLAELGFPDRHWVLNVNGEAGLQLVAVSPEEGAIAPGESEEVTVLVDATGAEPGTYEFELLVSTNNPSSPTETVDVTVVVRPPVSNEDGAIPAAFVVEQNYPNPFGAQTAIRYGLAEAGPVEVSVYDAVGRLVATLVDAEQGAGYHTAQWDARGVASGLYVYRVTAGAETRTLKMTLVR